MRQTYQGTTAAFDGPKMSRRRQARLAQEYSGIRRMACHRTGPVNRNVDPSSYEDFEAHLLAPNEGRRMEQLKRSAILMTVMMFLTPMSGLV